MYSIVLVFILFHAVVMTLTRPLVVFLLFRNTPLAMVEEATPRALATTSFVDYNTPMTSAAAAAAAELFEMTENHSSVFTSCTADDEGGAAYEEPDRLARHKPLTKGNHFISFLSKATYQALYLSPILCVLYSLAAGLICK